MCLLCYLSQVIVELLQSFLAVYERVAGAFPQLHQQRFVSGQKLTSSVYSLDVTSDLKVT